VSTVAHTAIAGWPLAGALATALVGERLRAARRRAALNRAMHELRRPVQMLALSSGPSRAAERGTPLDMVIAALTQLDREVNGGHRRRHEIVGAENLVRGAVARWRPGASRHGVAITLRWRAGRTTVVADPAGVAQALDNLIANALEHGGPNVVVEGRSAGSKLRISVADDGVSAWGRELSSEERGSASRAGRGERDHRHGHGLEIVRAVAAAHRGRFAFQRTERGSVAILELPLAGAGDALAA
jgi:signal transduction histidine kinase